MMLVCPSRIAIKIVSTFSPITSILAGGVARMIWNRGD
jgi:hypothetical protein